MNKTRSRRNAARGKSASSSVPNSEAVRLPGRAIISEDQLVQSALDGLIRHGRKKRFLRRGKQVAIVLAVVILLAFAGGAMVENIDRLRLRHYFDQLELPFSADAVVHDTPAVPAEPEQLE